LCTSLFSSSLRCRVIFVRFSCAASASTTRRSSSPASAGQHYVETAQRARHLAVPWMCPMDRRWPKPWTSFPPASNVPVFVFIHGGAAPMHQRVPCRAWAGHHHRGGQPCAIAPARQPGQCAKPCSAWCCRNIATYGGVESGRHWQPSASALSGRGACAHREQDGLPRTHYRRPAAQRPVTWRCAATARPQIQQQGIIQRNSPAFRVRPCPRLDPGAAKRAPGLRQSQVFHDAAQATGSTSQLSSECWRQPFSVIHGPDIRMGSPASAPSPGPTR
jgi:hypothetical protein